MSEKRLQTQSRSAVHYSNLESKQITRECIESALILLLENKTFAEISISELVKRAGVSRTAFYRNYQSKEDVLQCALGDVVNATLNKLSLDPLSEDFWTVLFREVKAYCPSIRLLLKAGLGNTILEEITARAVTKENSDSIAARYGAILWAGAVYNVLINWVMSGAKESAEDMASICMHISCNPGWNGI